MKTLIHHLLGETRTAILAVLLLRPERPLHLRELVRLTGSSPGTLHRELRALVSHGVLKRTEVGRQVFHQADPECPVLPELTGLIRKTAGLADVIRAALVPLQADVASAFVFGSMARGDVHAHSDIDLFIVGNLSFAKAVLALEPAARSLGRDINPMVMTREQFEAKLAQRDGFVAQIRDRPRLQVMGDLP